MRPNYPLSRKPNRFWLVGLVIMILTLSCGVLELGLEQTKLITPMPPEFKDPIATPDPIEEQQTNQENTQQNQKGEIGLNINGPWLVFMTGTGNNQAQVWAANPDGGGMTLLASDAFIGGYRSGYVAPQVSPNGNYLAYIEVQQEPLFAYLHIISLPSGEDRKIVMLYDESFLGYRQEILDVILYQASSLAWSPDGRTLAFIGAMEGGTAELFLYSPIENSVSRLSDNPYQMYMPVWSQDGESILVTATSQFHQGEGFSPFMFQPDGLWAYDASEYRMNEIKWPFGSEPGYIKYSPWHDSSFIFFGSGSPCEDLNGCWLDVLSGDKGSFPFPIIVYAISPKTGNILATSFNTTLPSESAGTYLFSPEYPAGERLFAEELENIQWLEQGGVFTGKVTTVPELRLLQTSSSGEVVENTEWGVPGQYMELVSSPNGSKSAWYRYVDTFETGLWLAMQGRGMLELQPVFPGAVHDAVWSPNGESLFFVVDAFNPPPSDSTQGLYIVDNEGQNPIFLFSIPPENFLTILEFAGN